MAIENFTATRSPKEKCTETRSVMRGSRSCFVFGIATADIISRELNKFKVLSPASVHIFLKI